MGLQAVDDKGRVAIPSGLRQTLERNIGPEAAANKETRTVVVSIDNADGCISAYDAPYFDELQARLETAAADERGLLDRNVLRAGIGPAENAQFDGSGRFILPKHIKRGGGIVDHAFFFGMGSVIEIWDPKRLLEHPTAPEAMKNACRDMLEDKGIVL